MKQKLLTEYTNNETDTINGVYKQWKDSINGVHQQMLWMFKSQLCLELSVAIPTTINVERVIPLINFFNIFY
jgi:hypothetical protein